MVKTINKHKNDNFLTEQTQVLQRQTIRHFLHLILELKTANYTKYTVKHKAW